MNVKDALIEIKKLVEHTDLNVFYGPTEDHPTENQIFIGIGWKTDFPGIVLNNKINGENSVSELVYLSSEETVNIWKRKLKNPRNLEQASIFMEDLSPDSCMAFIIFFLRLQGIDVEEFPAYLIDYVNRWEDGNVKTTGTPPKSFGALHSALAHDYFDTEKNGKHDPNIRFKKGFMECILFDLEILLQDINPFDVTSMNSNRSFHRALAILHQEEQYYKQALNHSNLLQIELPIVDSDRRILIDAFLSTEKHIYGIQKVFLRNDQENTWFKNGFGLMALYRPEAKGTGNDIVISVDPSIGVHLKDLWERLEQKENEKWGDARPTDNPRKDLEHLTQANQPWYIEQKNYSLVAAPKKIKGRDVFGSKVTWDEVVNIMWDLYHPAKHIKVKVLKEEGDQVCCLNECKPIVQNNKALLMMEWEEDDNTASIVLSPTMKRYLAALISKYEQDNIKIQDLPQELTYDLIEIPGGFTVVHERGVLLFNDWSSEDSRIPLYKEEYFKILEKYQNIKDLKKQIKQEINEIVKHFNKVGIFKSSELLELNNRLTHYKMNLRHTLLETLPENNNFHLILFHKKVEERWGMESHMEELYNSVSEIEQVIKGYTETRTNHLINNITIFGFPFLLFASLFQFVFQGISNWDWFFAGLVVFLAFSFSGIQLLRKYLIPKKKDHPKREEDKSESQNATQYFNGIDHDPSYWQ